MDVNDPTAVLEPESVTANPQPEHPVERHDAASTQALTQATLDRILEELRGIRRAEQQREFSLRHLIGVIAQAFALCATIWAVIVLIDNQPNASNDATIRFLAAIVFQLMALTGFASSGRS